MLPTGSSESYVHKVDGSPDERRCRRIRIRNLTVRNPVLGTVVDMTEDGLGIVCNRQLRVFDRYVFTIVADKTSRFRRQGEVRWSRLTAAKVSESGEPQLAYRVGIAFLGS